MLEGELLTLSLLFVCVFSSEGIRVRLPSPSRWSWLDSRQVPHPGIGSNSLTFAWQCVKSAWQHPECSLGILNCVERAVSHMEWNQSCVRGEMHKQQFTPLPMETCAVYPIPSYHVWNHFTRTEWGRWGHLWQCTFKQGNHAKLMLNQTANAKASKPRVSALLCGPGGAVQWEGPSIGVLH